MNPCEICYGHETVDCPYSCRYCALGNPCLGCADYDTENDTCKSEGACGDQANKWKGTDCEEKTERTHLMNWGYERD